MSEGRFQHNLSIVTAIAGAVGGTIALCQPIEQFWGALGWTISLLSLVQILATRRAAADDVEPPTIVWRVLLASVFTFCLLILTTMFVAAAAAGK